MNYMSVSRCNEKYIVGTRLNKIRVDRQHPNLIFGYDLKNKIFKICNYNAEREYSILNVSFKDFEKAFYSKEIEGTGYYKEHGATKYLLSLYSFHKLYNYELNPKRITGQLEELFYSKDSSIYNYNFLRLHKHNVWGLKTYESFKENFCKKNIWLDDRGFLSLWEHKKVMNFRISYLEKKKLIKSAEKYIEDYSFVEKKSNEP